MKSRKWKKISALLFLGIALLFLLSEWQYF